jgi:hypothetical protein
VPLAEVRARVAGRLRDDGGAAGARCRRGRRAAGRSRASGAFTRWWTTSSSPTSRAWASWWISSPGAAPPAQPIPAGLQVSRSASRAPGGRAARSRSTPARRRAPRARGARDTPHRRRGRRWWRWSMCAGPTVRGRAPSLGGGDRVEGVRRLRASASTRWTISARSGSCWARQAAEVPQDRGVLG